jgi:Tol biopolymer transport system component
MWLIDVATGTGVRLTLDGAGRFPVWSSDGGTVMFSSSAGFFRKSATGAGREEEVFKKDNWTAQLDDWSFDGKYLIGSYVDKVTNRDIARISIGEAAGNAAEPQFQPFAATGANELQGQISPDGKWIAYVSDETGSTEIVADSFPKPGNKRQVSASGGVQPKWSRDGKELLYVSLDRKLMSLPITNRETLTFGVPASLFDMPSVRTTAVGIGTRAQYDISPSGQRILINTALAARQSPRLHVILNWPELLDDK